MGGANVLLGVGVLALPVEKARSVGVDVRVPVAGRVVPRGRVGVSVLPLKVGERVGVREGVAVMLGVQVGDADVAFVGVGVHDELDCGVGCPPPSSDVGVGSMVGVGVLVAVGVNVGVASEGIAQMGPNSTVSWALITSTSL